MLPHQEFLEWAVPNLPLVPEGKCEGVEVQHKIIPAGKVIPVISMRNAIFMGQKPTNTTLPFDYTLQELSYEGGIWMTNSLQEVYQMAEAVKRCPGQTLIGGLGLGILTHLHSLYHGVDNLTVEQDHRIVELVAPWVETKYGGDVVTDDLFNFVREMPADLVDYAIYDTWQPTGARIWVSHIVPLRRLSRNKIAQQNIFCWNEEEMVGQLRMEAANHLFISEELASSWAVNYVLNKKGRELGLPILLTDSRNVGFEFFDEVNKATTPELKALIERFLTTPGTDTWEKESGKLWDEFMATNEVESTHPVENS